jgi:hypothetical protein
MLEAEGMRLQGAARGAGALPQHEQVSDHERLAAPPGRVEQLHDGRVCSTVGELTAA